MTPGMVLRSVLLALVEIVTVPPFALIALATFPFPRLTRYRIITLWSRLVVRAAERICGIRYRVRGADRVPRGRSEEHTSELQSQSNLVCRLLLEKKKK